MRLSRTVLSFLSTSALFGVMAPYAVAATSSDSEVQELKREIADMRREMQAMHKQIRQAPAEQTDRSHRARTVASQTPTDYTGAPEAGVRIGQVQGIHYRSASNDDGRPAPDRADVTSWLDYQAASKTDEEVQIGGMKIGFPNGRPTIQSEDGRYSLSIGLSAMEDFGGFVGNRPKKGETRGTFDSFTSNTRRIRIPFTFRYKNWVAAVTPDFGQGNNDGQVGLYEANFNYAGFHNTILTVGYFQPRVTEEDAESSNDFEMLERPGITDVVRNIAAGDARFSVGGLHYDKRWWVAGYFTGQTWGNRNTQGYYGTGTGVTDSQTGGMFRAAGRPVATKDFDLHVGISSIAAFKPGYTSGTNGRTFTLSERPEVNLGETTLLSTGAITHVAQVWAAGPELGFRWNRLLLKGEFYNIGVNRSEGYQNYNFQGWYGAAAYTIFGEPRKYNIKEGAFAAPGVKDTQEFDPMHNQWGALEIVARYSGEDFNSNLNSASAFRGGQQTVWAGGFNWYPNRHFAIKVDYNHFVVSRNSQAANLYGRSGDSLAARIQAAF